MRMFCLTYPCNAMEHHASAPPDNGPPSNRAFAMALFGLNWAQAGSRWAQSSSGWGQAGSTSLSLSLTLLGYKLYASWIQTMYRNHVVQHTLHMLTLHGPASLIVDFANRAHYGSESKVQHYLNRSMTPPPPRPHRAGVGCRGQATGQQFLVGGWGAYGRGHGGR